MSAVPVQRQPQCASCALLKRSQRCLWLSQTHRSRLPGDRVCARRYLGAPPGLLCRLQKGFISYAGSKTATWQAVGHSLQVVWSKRDCLDTSPRPHGPTGIAKLCWKQLKPALLQRGPWAWCHTAQWSVCLKIMVTSQEQSLLLSSLLSRAPSLKTVFPFSFKQDYGIFKEERNGRCVGKVSGGQGSPCQGVL